MVTAAFDAALDVLQVTHGRTSTPGAGTPLTLRSEHRPFSNDAGAAGLFEIRTPPAAILIR